jgi:hypothetical protein
MIVRVLARLSHIIVAILGIGTSYNRARREVESRSENVPGYHVTRNRAEHGAHNGNGNRPKLNRSYTSPSAHNTPLSQGSRITLSYFSANNSPAWASLLITTTGLQGEIAIVAKLHLDILGHTTEYNPNMMKLTFHVRIAEQTS